MQSKAACLIGLRIYQTNDSIYLFSCATRRFHTLYGKIQNRRKTKRRAKKSNVSKVVFRDYNYLRFVIFRIGIHHVPFTLLREFSFLMRPPCAIELRSHWNNATLTIVTKFSHEKLHRKTRCFHFSYAKIEALSAKWFPRTKAQYRKIRRRIVWILNGLLIHRTHSLHKRVQRMFIDSDYFLEYTKVCFYKEKYFFMYKKYSFMNTKSTNHLNVLISGIRVFSIQKDLCWKSIVINYSIAVILRVFLFVLQRLVVFERKSEITDPTRQHYIIRRKNRKHYIIAYHWTLVKVGYESISIDKSYKRIRSDIYSAQP